MTDGVGAAALEKLSVTVEKIRDTSHRLFGVPAASRSDDPPYSADAVAAIEAAGRFALERSAAGPPAMAGTEHLLAVLALDYGSRARRILNELGVNVADLKGELECFLDPHPRRPVRGRRRRRRRSLLSPCLIAWVSSAITAASADPNPATTYSRTWSRSTSASPAAPSRPFGRYASTDDVAATVTSLAGPRLPR